MLQMSIQKKKWSKKLFPFQRTGSASISRMSVLGVCQDTRWLKLTLSSCSSDIFCLLSNTTMSPNLLPLNISLWKRNLSTAKTSDCCNFSHLPRGTTPAGETRPTYTNNSTHFRNAWVLHWSSTAGTTGCSNCADNTVLHSLKMDTNNIIHRYKENPAVRGQFWGYSTCYAHYTREITVPNVRLQELHMHYYYVYFLLFGLCT